MNNIPEYNEIFYLQVLWELEHSWNTIIAKSDCLSGPVKIRGSEVIGTEHVKRPWNP